MTQRRGTWDPYPRPLNPMLQAIVSAPCRPAYIWSIYFRYRDTAGGHCQGALSSSCNGSFTSHSMSVRPHHHLPGNASHKRYIISNVEGWERNLHKPLLCTMGIEPGATTWQACMLPLCYWYIYWYIYTFVESLTAQCPLIISSSSCFFFSQAIGIIPSMTDGQRHAQEELELKVCRCTQ